jgi:hypothetical protein
MERQRMSPRSTSIPIGPASRQLEPVLSAERLQELFVLPLEAAAKRMGVGATFLKKACRKVGISKWPYRKVIATDHFF